MGMTTALIDDFTEELLFEDELAPKTVHDVLVVLHGILKYTAACFSGGFPGIDLNYPKPCKKEMRVLSREEQARFVSYLLEDMDSCKFGVLLTLFTGIRIGELCALRWSNLSVKEQTIRIDATLQRLRDTNAAGNSGSRTRIVIGTPKSDTSIRTIPITDYLDGDGIEPTERHPLRKRTCCFSGFSAYDGGPQENLRAAVNTNALLLYPAAAFASPCEPEELYRSVCLSALYAHHRQMSSVAWEKAVLEFLKAAFSNMNKSNG